MGSMWLYLLSNIISLSLWIFLAVKFDMWWLSLFFILFFLIPAPHQKIVERKWYRVCDKCGKHSPYANSDEEAIKKAGDVGWITFKNEKNNFVDYCPDCQNEQ